MRKYLALIMVFSFIFNNVYASSWERSYDNSKEKPKKEDKKDRKSSRSNSDDDDDDDSESFGESIGQLIALGIIKGIGYGIYYGLYGAYLAVSVSDIKIGVGALGNVSGGSNLYSGYANPSFDIAIEWTFPVIEDKLKLGFGFGGNVGGSYKDDNKTGFGYMPIYATVKAFPFEAAPHLYFAGNIGGVGRYYVEGDSAAGKLYWGAGAGYDFQGSYFVETMCESYYGQVNTDSGYTNTRYTKLGINVGIRLRSFKTKKEDL